METIKEVTDKWGDKFLSLKKEDDVFKLIVVKKVYNPQTEITDFQEHILFNVYSLQEGLKLFEDYRKGFKLRCWIKNV